MSDSSVRIDAETKQMLEDEKHRNNKPGKTKTYIKDLIKEAVNKCYKAKK